MSIPQTQKPTIGPALPTSPKDADGVFKWIVDALLPNLNNQFTDVRTSLRRITIANMSAALLTTTTPVGPNTEFNLSHNLGRIPVIYVPNVDVAGAVVYKGATPWTNKLIYLKCTGVSVGLTLLVL